MVQVGNSFDSYEDFDKALKEYCNKNYVCFYKREARTILAASRKTERSLNKKLKYYQLKYACIKGGKAFHSKGKGQRNKSTYKNGCSAHITLRASKCGERLEIISMSDEHNHEITQETSTQRKRRLEKEKQKRQEKLQQESEADRSARLDKQRKRMTQVRSNETMDERSLRLAKDAHQHAQARANERLERQGARQAQVRANETPDERISRLAKDAFRHAQRRAIEASEAYISRLESDRLRHAESRARETSQEREARLRRQREAYAQGLLRQRTLINTEVKLEPDEDQNEHEDSFLHATGSMYSIQDGAADDYSESSSREAIFVRQNKDETPMLMERTLINTEVKLEPDDDQNEDEGSLSTPVEVDNNYLHATESTHLIREGAEDGYYENSRKVRQNSVETPVSKVCGIKRKRYIPPHKTTFPYSSSKQSTILTAVNKLNEISQLAASIVSKKRDMYDHFGDYVASVLREAGGQKAMTMQQEIGNVIFKYMTDL